jgi:GT2 family glycosyltransferase
MNSAIDLSIIIVNWNSAKFVRECIKSIQLNTPKVSWEVIVVDSGSFDDCGKMLSREFPGAARFVQCKTNVGFSTGNNLGAAYSRGKVLLFLNPDTEVTVGALDSLYSALVDCPKAGIAGSCLLNTDRSLQTSCVQAFPTVLNQVLDAELLRRLFPRSRMWGIMSLFEKTENVQSVEVISGACIMIKRGVFDQVSGFDQRYFMYSEDLDLCYRVQQLGFRNLYVPRACIVHHGGGSSASARSMFSVVMMRESVFKFIKIHHGRLQALFYRLALGLSALIRVPLLIFRIVLRLGSVSSGLSSIKKWIAILRWSAGFESWAAKKSGGLIRYSQSMVAQMSEYLETSEVQSSCAE